MRQHSYSDLVLRSVVAYLALTSVKNGSQTSGASIFCAKAIERGETIHVSLKLEN